MNRELLPLRLRAAGEGLHRRFDGAGQVPLFDDHHGIQQDVESVKERGSDNCCDQESSELRLVLCEHRHTEHPSHGDQGDNHPKDQEAHQQVQLFVL